MQKVEIFSAGCPACEEVIEMVNDLACTNCEISVLDMNQKEVATRAKSLGIERVPAVVVNGQLAECCQGKGPSRDALKAAGVGKG